MASASAQEIQAAVCKLLDEASAEEICRLARDPDNWKPLVGSADVVDKLVDLVHEDPEGQGNWAMFTLQQVLREESSAHTIVQEYGVPFLFHILALMMSAEQHQTEQKIGVVDILTTVFDTNHGFLVSEYLVSATGDCDEALVLLVDVLDDSNASSSTDKNVSLAEKLGGLIQILLLRLSEPTETQTTILKMLEHLSRIPSHHAVFQEYGGVKRLVSLLKASNSTSAELLSTTARILANLACKDEDMSRLIIESDALGSLIAMIKSTDNKVVTASLMALRSLSNCDANRDRIGIMTVVLRLGEIITEDQKLKQRVVAAAVVGNLAHLPIAKQRILFINGEDDLVQLLCDVQTPSQAETVAAALWVLTNNEDTIDHMREEGAVAALLKTVQRMQLRQVPWASRLLQRLTQQSK